MKFGLDGSVNEKRAAGIERGRLYRGQEKERERNMKGHAAAFFFAAELQRIKVGVSHTRLFASNVIPIKKFKST